MAKGASAWVKSFRRRAEAYAGHPDKPTQGTRLSYWEAKAAGAFDVAPAPARATVAVMPMHDETLASIIARLLGQEVTP